MVTKSSDPEARADALAQRLNALRVPAVRRQALADALASSAPQELVLTLHALVAGQRTKPTRARAAALETLATTLSTPDLISYDTRVELYAAAKDNGCDEIARMLFETSATQPVDDDGTAERPLRPRGKPLTLGERKSLARGHVRETLELLLLDPNRDVVEILLGNPHVTERDVVAIATRRPTPADVLTTVAASERWIARYAVKRSLVLNPYTPPHLSVRLVTTLNATDLRMVASDAKLPEPLRDQARALLAH